MDEDLDAFRSYLAERGISDGTLNVYVSTARRALAGGGWVKRLTKGELAPKTLRVTLAAARHYAAWSEDARLAKALSVMRLPAARRQGVRIPLEREDLDKLVAHLRRDHGLRPEVAAVIGLMATRGMRIGDVLRLRRSEVEQALATGKLTFYAKGRRRLEYNVLRAFRPFLEALLRTERRWSKVADLISPGAASDNKRDAAARAVERGMRRLALQAGVVGLHPHRLRRTYAVQFLRALRGDPEALPKLVQHMGWADMSTALEYIDHARGEELDRVADRIFDQG